MFDQFTELADHYDSLMADVPYTVWVDYLQSLFAIHDIKPETILDIACGTGNVTEELYDRGYKVTGVDISAPMIRIAKRKAESSGRKINYIVCDVAELNLQTSFDLAISLFDSVNYICDPQKLLEGFKKISSHLNQGAFFIFDINTEYALSHHFFDQVNLDLKRLPRYVWTSYYDHSTRICKVEMVFEVFENGKKRQFTEIHYQRAYSIAELTSLLSNAGFETISVYHAYSFKKPTAKSDRVFFVSRRLLT